MTKYFLTIVFIFSIISLNAQKVSFMEYKYLSKPDSTNKASQYFKNNIDPEILRNAKFPKNKTIITTFFYVNNKKEIYSASLPSPQSKLSQRIFGILFNRFQKESFYDLKEDSYYSMQIVSKENGIPFFNCSSNPIQLTSPICDDCDNEILYFDKLTCTKLKIREHFYNNFNFEIFKEHHYDKLYIKYKINEDGKLRIVKGPNENPKVLSEKIQTLVEFPFSVKPATKNGSYVETTYSFTINYDENFKPISIRYDDKHIDSVTENKKLLEYLQSNITEEDLKFAELSYYQPTLFLKYEMSNDGKIFNLSSNGRSNYLKYKINKLIRNAPKETLDLYTNHNIDKCQLTLLYFKNNKTIINPNPVVMVYQHPTMESCTKLSSTIERKNCTSKIIGQSIYNNLDTSKFAQLPLKAGKHTIISKLLIKEDGFVTLINSNTKHSVIEDEIRRIIKLIPKFNHPGLKQGKPYRTIYSLPISFMVE